MEDTITINSVWAEGRGFGQVGPTVVACLDHLEYVSYHTQRRMTPWIPPDRWSKLFPQWEYHEVRLLAEAGYRNEN